MKTIKQIILILLLTIPFVYGQNNSNGISNSTWLRVDGDRDGMYYWIGGSSDLNNLSLSHEIIYFQNNNKVEIEVGPYFSFLKGKFDVLPMLGILMNLESGETEYLLPQVYFYYNIDSFSIELWNMYYLSSLTKCNSDFYYGRYISKVKLNKYFAIGAQAEINIDLQDGLNERVSSFVIGGVVGIKYSKELNFNLFLGADTKSNNKNNLAARFTFIRTF